MQKHEAHLIVPNEHRQPMYKPQNRKRPFFFFSFCSIGPGPSDIADPAGEGIGEGPGRNLFAREDGAGEGAGAAGAGGSLI
jgi:hypothetical protein